MYDVIVIGAGPCGSMAARTLAQSGLKVLLLEKFKLPRDKSCSGVLIEKSLRFLGARLGRSVPESVTCTPVQTRGMIFTDDNGREYKFESSGLNVWREKFDFWLTSLAKEAGARVIDGCAVTHIQETNGIVTVSGKGVNETAKFAIDCTGVVGIGKQTHGFVRTYQTYNRGTVDLEEHYFYAYLQPELSGYDAWFNCKDGMLLLGVATPAPEDAIKYYRKFITYMSEKHGLRITEQLKTDQWLMRRVQPPFEIDYGRGGVLKAGEAAGFLNPMGEGISAALKSGHYAALAIASNFHDKQRVIEKYRESVSETKDYMQRQWKLVGRISQKFSFMND